MKKMTLLAPSILSADLARLGQEVLDVLAAGADRIHFDVMDNHYVPNLTFGPLVCKALRKAGIEAPIDVHLMVKPVTRLIESFAKAGASSITFHPEASDCVEKDLSLIQALGCEKGLALNPAESLSTLEPYLGQLDMLLLMSVNPGFAGQSFITEVMSKIKAARTMLDEASSSAHLSVDGGIHLDNVSEVVGAGANLIVAGSAIFSAENYAQCIQAWREKLSLLSR